MLPASADYLRFLPEILLTIFGIAAMMLEAVAHGKRTYLGVISLIGIAAAFVANFYSYTNQGAAFQNMLIVDGYGVFFRGLLLVAGFLCVLSSLSYLER